MRRLIVPALAAAMAMPALTAAAAPKPAAELYKDPNCGCCAAYADRLREAGYPVTVRETENLTALKRQMSVPDAMESCHTTLVGGYVVEGHVPLRTVERLLAERPPIRGIALPGMPAGSPGMGGAKTEPFTVYTLGDGAPAVWAVE